VVTVEGGCVTVTVVVLPGAGAASVVVAPTVVVTAVVAGSVRAGRDTVGVVRVGAVRVSPAALPPPPHELTAKAAARPMRPNTA
jgi:hypothetical protein